MGKSTIGNLIIKIFIGIVLLALGYFFLSPLFNCNNVKISDTRLLRDSTEQKKIDSIDAVNALQKKQIDSLEDLSEQKNRRLRDLQITYEYTIYQLKNKPAKVLYKEVQTRIPRSDTNSVLEYCYDSTQQYQISKCFVEVDNQKQVINVLKQKDTICNNTVIALHKITDNQSEMLKLKDSQIRKLENIPPIVIKRKWYVDAAIIIGSITLGYTIKSLTK